MRRRRDHVAAIGKIVDQPCIDDGHRAAPRQHRTQLLDVDAVALGDIPRRHRRRFRRGSGMAAGHPLPGYVPHDRVNVSAGISAEIEVIGVPRTSRASTGTAPARLWASSAAL